MGMGSLTLACVLMLANAGPEAEPYFMNRPKMAIPITIDPDQRHNLRELILFCSKDEGKTWSQVGRATPEQSSFPFNAPGDGKYWFTIQTVDKNGVKSPPDLLAAPVGQRIIIDTVRPQVKVKAERKGDEILVSWEINEDYPNPSTFALEYHLADQPSAIWTAVANVVPGATGSATFRPQSNGAISVQLRVKDKAENEGVGVVEVAAAGPALASQPAGNSQNDVWSGETAHQTLTLPNSRSPEPALPLPLPVATVSALPTPPVAAPPLQSQPVSAPPPIRSASMKTLRGALPAKLLVNKAEAKLDFDVTNLGPSGFGTVDVWMTGDEGTTWTPMKLDTGAIQMPEMRMPGQVRGSVMVHVPDEGRVFGYYLVVKSKADLGKPAPRPGDLPQIRLERDSVAPTAQLNLPKPDDARRDTLLLTWKAEDKNLTEKPISLEWAPFSEGPWEFIGGPELPNTGRFAWQVPSTVPPRVFLKMTVRDAAGNVSVAQSANSVLVDLNIPEIAAVSLSQTQ